jgi:hypothetical protein
LSASGGQRISHSLHALRLRIQRSESLLRLLLTLLLFTVTSALAVPAQTPTLPTDATVTASPTPPSTPPVVGSVVANASRVATPKSKSENISLVRFEKPPVIDGHLEDDAWRQAAIFRDFQQVEPGDNTPPSHPTEVLMGYDARYLYIAFRAHDEPGKVRVTVAKRDAISADDQVGMFLDTYNDQRRAYVLFFNPLGVQADAILTEGAGEDYSVDIVMDSKGVVTNKGYSVEVAIPFKSLRYQAGKGKLWGVHFFRRIKRFNNELDSWMSISRDNSSLLNQAGHIMGLEDISTERTIELIPSLTVSERGGRVRTVLTDVVNRTPGIIDPGRFVNTPIEFDPGLTAKFGITPTVTLDFALNPDFAQVEADQTVNTANQRFPIFFEEKRPFFLEGKDIFQTLITAVHTRAIVDPDHALKLTGKLGRNTFGLLVASDNAPGNFSEDVRTDPGLRRGIERLLDHNASIGVLRLKRDVGRESNIGLLATTYNFVDLHNNLAGFDGRFRLNPTNVVSFQVLGTTSRRHFYDPDLNRLIYRTGNAFAYAWRYDHVGRHFGFSANGEGFTRDYRANVGFTVRTNTNIQRTTLRLNTEPDPKARIIQYRFNNLTTTRFDWQGRSQRMSVQPQLTLHLQRQSVVTFGMQRGYERVIEEEFGKQRTVERPCDPFGNAPAPDPSQPQLRLPLCAFFGLDSERSTTNTSLFVFADTTPNKKYSFSTQIAYEMGVFDFDFGAGPRFPRVSPAALANPRAPLDPGAGNLLTLFFSGKYQPSNELRASLDYTKERLVRTDTRRVAFDENILSLRTTYQFTRFTFARARIDYSSLASRLRGQFLLGWTPNPGTSFYVGYNDDLTRDGFSPFTGQLEPGFRRNGRTFFIKMAYLFRRSF